jgi:hypothetical protein
MTFKYLMGSTPRELTAAIIELLHFQHEKLVNQIQRHGQCDMLTNAPPTFPWTFHKSTLRTN